LKRKLRLHKGKRPQKEKGEPRKTYVVVACPSLFNSSPRRGKGEVKGKQERESHKLKRKKTCRHSEKKGEEKPVCEKEKWMLREKKGTCTSETAQ